MESSDSKNIAVGYQKDFRANNQKPSLVRDVCIDQDGDDLCIGYLESCIGYSGRSI